jgi:hypothetical protein
MKTILFTALISFITINAFACPGSTTFVVETEVTKIEGDKVKGEMNVTDKSTRPATVTKIKFDKLPYNTRFLFPYGYLADEFFTFGIHREESGEKVYKITYKTKNDEETKYENIYPSQIARGGCGVEIKF